MISDIKKNQKAFVVRMSRQPREAMQKGLIAIGWSNADDLNASLTWLEFKNEIKKRYSRYERSGRALGNAAGSVWRFIKTSHSTDNVIDIGDWVLLPGVGGRGTFYIGEITSNVKHVKDDWARANDLQWQREVRWLTPWDKPIQRDAASVQLQSRMKAYQTCVDATDLLDDIKDVSVNRNRVRFDSHVRNQAKAAIESALTNTINADQLEELVKRLCLASGASKVLIPSKNNRLDGDADADVVADYPVFVAGERKVVQVIYQVKCHVETTGRGGVMQVRQRILEMDKNDDVNVLIRTGCLVTTAEQVSKNAIDEAANIEDLDEPIKIVEKNELISWILDSGIRNLDF